MEQTEQGATRRKRISAEERIATLDFGKNIDEFENAEPVKPVVETKISRPNRSHILENTIFLNGTGYAQGTRLDEGKEVWLRGQRRILDADLFDTLCSHDAKATEEELKIKRGRNVKAEVRVDGTIRITSNY